MKTYFQHFSTSIKGIALPKKVNFPFYYETHPLCQIAANELQHYLQTQNDFEHNFGLNPNQKGLVIGKMFGVLVVQNKKDKLGYIAAVSGKLAETNTHKIFVPPIFDMLTKDSHFLKEEEMLNILNQKCKDLENTTEYSKLLFEYKIQKQKAIEDIQQKRLDFKIAKQKRKQIRENSNFEKGTKEYVALKIKLAQESIESKSLLNNVNRYWKHILDGFEEKLKSFTNQIELLKKKRKEKSNALQQYLFEQYQFLNAKNEIKNLVEIFRGTNELKPPSGAGDCAAPKLLQYAFTNDLKPIVMAEFWWGSSPNSQVRKHKQFYPACQRKCKPILTHMLKGLQVDKNPMLENTAIGKELEFLFEDDDIIVIHKPEEFLSVPGIHIQDSVYTRIKDKYPNITGAIIVHRLDMSTSGIMVLSKNKEAHKNLQQQFINRTVKKRYEALLDGIVEENSGTIELPLRVDLDDRPRQLVCYKYGKNAKTLWRVVERKNGKTKIYLYPITGRTHQLRVHCSHAMGLNTPITGDDLYGTKAKRLYLHASKISFKHPITKEEMSFVKKNEF